VTRLHARSFHFSSFPLPEHRRQAAFAVYAFCRYVDDAVDRHHLAGPGARPALEAELGRIEAGTSTLELAPAFAAAMRAFAIERSLFLDLIEGCCRDASGPVRIRDFAELEEYCYLVASVVGLIMGRVFGLADPAGVERAVQMGVAMQLTNILRDVSEDLANDRIYLPADELAAAGFGEAFLRRGEVTPPWRQFLAGQVDRARAWYRAGAVGLPLLAGDGSRLAAKLMARIYAGILDEIEARDYDVFSGRAKVPFRRKLRLASAVLLGAAVAR
jgi:phytoene synthase